jgi:hypothetical protein
MIRYALRCPVEHGFEAWFSSSESFDDQAARGLIECPSCGSTAITKAIMAPSVVSSRKAEATASAQMEQHRRMAEMAHKIRQHVETNFDYVGDRFAAEAREIHDGEAPERPIYGEAKAEEVKALIDDGIPVAPLPVFTPPTHDGAAPASVPSPATPPRVSGPRKVN